MDASEVFRQIQGIGTYHQRLPQAFPPRKPVANVRHGEGGAPNRIAHTLTACCRCRQRKTRCDPTLPRCLPCERSGSICEYFDTTKGKKISRYYVVKLQDRVRTLEAELGQYTDEEDYPQNYEDIIRPGGLVQLKESDETPRYLGPSSGIGMTRILMEEAKRYTDSKSISELVPGMRLRREAMKASGAGAGAVAAAMRSQSFSMPPSNSSRKKSFPMMSAGPARNLPSKSLTDGLLDIYIQRGQILAPILHEKNLMKAFDDVYAGSQCAYQNFVTNMVLAISLQKLEVQYAGLGDGYYQAARQYFEAVVRPKDLKTLQCLLLICNYSYLTPTRTAVYYVVGLATRICQQLGLADEKTISMGTNDPVTLDLRRRLSWAVISMEFGMAHTMGRPVGFAKSDDIVDIEFFDSARDDNITENGILPGPPDDKKLVAIHYCKMRLLFAEIRRVLYEKKQNEPKDDRHAWFASVGARMSEWLESSPQNPPWCKPWFTGKYHTMVVCLHRPSPQVPNPSSRSAMKCFESSAFVINISSKQMMAAAVDITWTFILTLYMSLNTILWSIASYPEVRSAHPREDVEELINVSLDIMDQCVARWPGTEHTPGLYSIFAKACLQSYEVKEAPRFSNSSTFGTPPSQADTNSPPVSEISSATTMSQTSAPAFNPPQFGYVFDTAPEQIKFDNPFLPHPTFRSNSIFQNPASSESNGRRFSYFPPDAPQFNENMYMDEVSPSVADAPTVSPPTMSSNTPHHVPTPPDSIPPGAAATPVMSTPIMSTSTMSTPNMAHASPSSMQSTPAASHRSTPATFTIPPLPHHQPQGQRPLPPTTNGTDWFSPPQPFISPYAFGNTGGNFWGDSSHGNNLDAMGMGNSQFSGLPFERRGSLSQAQHVELMDILEHDGMSDIDAYLNLGMGMGYANNILGSNPAAHVNWTGTT